MYLAEDTNLRRRVALKFLPADTASSPEAAARLLRESRAASALDHPHIATVYEIGNHAGQPYIAMAHYEGETHGGRRYSGCLASRRDSPAAAHTAGIVHRDLKGDDPEAVVVGHRPDPDERWLLFPVTDREGRDLMLVDNIR